MRGTKMQRRRRFKQTSSLQARLADEAKRLREEARSLPPGAQRDDLIRRALATPPISNEEIIRRSKQEPRKRPA